MSIWIVGDIHSNSMNERTKCNTSNWPEQKDLTKDDVLVQLGDWGEMWYYPENSSYKEDEYWQAWWGSRPYTLLVIPGNHENYDMIDRLPEIEKWNGTVKVLKTGGKGKKFIEGEIYIAKRGEIYEIQGKKILAISGASSVDKEHRTAGISWWPQETITSKEIDYTLDNIEKHEWSVDFVLTHAMPVQMIRHFIHHTIDNDIKFKCQNAEFLGYLWDTDLDFKAWHVGHYHTNHKEYRHIPFHNEHGHLVSGPDIDNDFIQCHYNKPPECILKD